MSISIYVRKEENGFSDQSLVKNPFAVRSQELAPRKRGAKPTGNNTEKKALPNDTNVERSRCENHVDRLALIINSIGEYDKKLLI